MLTEIPFSQLSFDEQRALGQLRAPVDSDPLEAMLKAEEQAEHDLIIANHKPMPRTLALAMRARSLK